MSATWHAAPETLDRYAAEEIDDIHASSLEAHLLGCERCREALAMRIEASQVDAIWHGIESTLDAPRPGVVEQILLRIGVREDLARLLAATPSLRWSWFVAEALALGSAAIAAAAAAGTSVAGRSMFVFLVLAALAPVAGVAAAFGPGVDPTYEVGLAAPMRSDRLLLLRAGAVLCASVVIASLAALALPGTGWNLALWLVPALALTMATLALATWLRPVVAAVAVGAGWMLLAAIGAVANADPLATFRAVGQSLFLAVIVVAGLVFAARRSAYEGRIPA
jgi:hypothetical protein